MEIEDCLIYTFTWVASPDACPKCATLNGRTYRGQSIFQETLNDSEFGPVWSLDEDHSLAHGEQQYNCRCVLLIEVEVDESKLMEYLEADKSEELVP